MTGANALSLAGARSVQQRIAKLREKEPEADEIAAIEQWPSHFVSVQNWVQELTGTALHRARPVSINTTGARSQAAYCPALACHHPSPHHKCDLDRAVGSDWSSTLGLSNVPARCAGMDIALASH